MIPTKEQIKSAAIMHASSPLTGKYVLAIENFEAGVRWLSRQLLKKNQFLLINDLDGLRNLRESVLNNMYPKLIAEWGAKLKAYIKDNLKEFGYNFDTEAKFFEFCKNRVCCIACEDKSNEFEFYLDYVDAENTGKLIGLCSNKIDFKIDVNTVSVTIGKNKG